MQNPTSLRSSLLLALAAASLLTSACGTELEEAGDLEVPPTMDLGGIDPTGRSEAFGGGNGAPSGSHYNLNLIGVPKQKSADMTGNQGHRIFVNLEGRTRIDLGEGEFQVLDANGTDGRARFQLPAPDPDGDGVTAYSVWARALGTPGGSSTTTTCATDPTTGEEVCSTESLVLVRSSGKSRFSDVSRELLFVYADLDGDGTAERYGLFDDALTDYFWGYDNQGLKLAQLRFYPVSSTAGL